MQAFGLLLAFFIMSPSSSMASDRDGHGGVDASETCPCANSGQEDPGEIGSAGSDAIGTACQRGDLTHDGGVDLPDALLIARHTEDPEPSITTEACDTASQGATCDACDRHAVPEVPPGIARGVCRLCTAAQPDPRYAKIIVVSPVEGDPIASGSALLNAVQGITDASEDNRHLVRLLPGVYDLGSETLSSSMLVPFVDLAGSGATTTTITSSGRTIELIADRVGTFELSDVSVVHTGRDEAIVIFDRDLIARRVVVHSDGLRALDTHASDIEIEDARLSASSVAIVVQFGQMKMKSSWVRGNIGIIGDGASVELWNVSVVAKGRGVSMEGGGRVIRMRQSSVTADTGLAAELTTTIDLANVEIRARTGILSVLVRNLILEGVEIFATDTGLGGGCGEGGENPTGGSIRRSQITGVNVSLGFGEFSGCDDTVVVADSELRGPVQGTVFTCTNTFDGALEPLGADCRPMP